MLRYRRRQRHRWAAEDDAQGERRHHHDEHGRQDDVEVAVSGADACVREIRIFNVGPLGFVQASACADPVRVEGVEFAARRFCPPFWVHLFAGDAVVGDDRQMALF